MKHPAIIDWIRIPQETPIHTWEELLDTLPKYSYFQTPAWAELLTNSLDSIKPNHYFATFDDDVKCVIPGFTVPKKFGLHKYEALPWGTYGNPIGTGVTTQHLDAIGMKLVSFFQPIVQMILHPSFYGETDLHQTQPSRMKMCSTHILHINQPYEDLEKQRFQSRLRTTVRKAEQSGVLVRWSNDTATVERCKEIYIDAQKRWGGDLSVPLSFFDQLAGKSGDHIRVWVAEYEEKIIAFDIMFYGKLEVQYFTGAKLAEFDALNAPKLLMSRVIQDACQNGMALVNFGASAGLHGVEQFKERFGGIKSYYAELTYRHFAFRIVRGNG